MQLAFVQVALVVAAFVLSASLALRYSPTELEPSLLASGVASIELGRFDVYSVNPPFVKVLCAFPVALQPYKIDWSMLAGPPCSRTERLLGYSIVRDNAERFRTMLFQGRLVCSMFFAIGICAVIHWFQSVHRPQFKLFIFVPGILFLTECNLLGHSALITNDVPAAVVGVLALFSYRCWLVKPSLSSSIGAGIFLGVAQLTKFSWVLLFGLYPLLWIFYVISARPSIGHIRRRLMQLCIIFIVCFIVISAGYCFNGCFSQLRNLSFCSKCFKSIATFCIENTLAGTIIGYVPIPLPEDYIKGIDLQYKDFEDFEVASYLLGSWKIGSGWWYYYLFGFFFKLSHSGQIVCFAGVVYFFFRLGCQMFPQVSSKRRWVISQADLMLLFLPAAALFIVASLHDEFSIHFRYVFPCFPLLYILGCVCICDVFRSLRSQRVVFVVLVILGLINVSHYPHYISYFNELSGGTVSGWKLMLGSNYDWGQDAYLIRSRIERQGIPFDRVKINEDAYSHWPSVIGSRANVINNDYEFVLVSANEITRPGTQWLERLEAGEGIRICYTAWLFPIKNELSSSDTAECNTPSSSPPASATILD